MHAPWRAGPPRPRKTVVLVGGGHAHVQVLRRWAMEPPEDVRLLVVLDRPVAVYSGMVPGFVAGDYAHAHLEIDVVPLARRAGAGVILSAATDLDPVRHEIALAGRPPIAYDVASIDVGSTVRGLDRPGVRGHALATRPIARFVEQVDAQLDRLRALGRPPKIAIVGGGAAGSELALTLEARLRGLGAPSEITVFSADDALLAGSPPRVRRALAREAEARGVRSVFGVRVVRVEEEGLVTRDAARGDDGLAPETAHAADLVVWATGAAPVEFPKRGGTARLPRDESGFLSVRETLQVVGFDDLFAVGDCARLVDHPWVPRAGVYAVRQGPFLEKNLRATLAGRRLRSYRPQRDFLSLLNLGEGRALGSKWGLAARGRGVHALKDWIDERFMQRFQVLDRHGRPHPAMLDLGAMGGEDEAPMPCGGCAAKLGAEPLAAALSALPPPPPDASVVLGVDDHDDVAATRSPEGRVTLHNIDAIRAFADDPWLVGRVAASNALSDLFAKGGAPRHAQAIVALPEWPAREAEEALRQVLLGVRSILDPRDVALLGGHTTLGDALMVGLSVTGDGPPGDALLRQRGAQPGDVLLLTQPIGTGVVLAADMQGRARGEWVEAAYAAMQHTNDVAGRLAIECGVHAATDVTGFGLAGHLLTLLAGDDLEAVIDRDAMPLLPGARLLWDDGLRSTADPANREAFRHRIRAATEADLAWLLDPQTAGGLLLAAPEPVARRLAGALAEAGEPPVHRIGVLRAGERPGGSIALSASS